MVTKLLTKIFGSQHDRDMKRLRPLIEQINALEPGIQVGLVILLYVRVVLERCV